MEVAETALDTAYDAAFAEIRRRSRVGDDEGALRVAATIVAEATDPRIVSRALTRQVGSTVNLGRLDECPPLLDRAFDLLAGVQEHALLGGVHALASIVAGQSSMERCVRHLVQAWRELDQDEQPRLEAVEAWHNLAVSFSYSGFHGQAMAVAERGYLLGQRLGLRSADHALPEVTVRRAVALDHRGDTEECVRMLHDVLETWSRRTTPSNLWSVERLYYGYAAVRLSVLGEDVTVPVDVFGAADGWEADDLRLLAGACSAIVDGRPRDALAQLIGCQVNANTLGAAEIFRVRALAHSARGDHLAALAADRESTRLANKETDHLRDRLVDGMRMQLDHEALRRTVERYASEALTDPLTGLPNRRHFDRRIVQGGRNRLPSALGIIDLDDFKAVNTVHGHAGGDLVLQRVAAVLARTVRSGDFVARYGGDEFIVVLPDTDIALASQIGARIADAIVAEDWHALVAGTPVSITIGWAELTDVHHLPTALEIADHAMLARKEHNRQPQHSSR